MNNISELERQISKANDAYHNGQSIMDDDEYDALIYELSVLDPKHKLLSQVGADLAPSEWKKATHKYQLLSLNKVNATEEMSKWINETLNGQPILVEEKIDGLSLGLQYDNGKLIHAILRGAGGNIGEDILSNALKMKGVVNKIPNFSGVVRGEVVLFNKDYQDFFAKDYKNPRNTASGICRRLDGDGSEHLSLICYQVYGKEFSTQEDVLNWLLKQGFKTPNFKLYKTSSEVNNLWHEYQHSIRSSLEYEIDGLVISLNDCKAQNALGISSGRPKGKLAFKFSNQFIKTTINGIEWSCKVSGRISPTCTFDTVHLLGSDVSRASVYNIAYINKLGLGIGSEVLVCKSGEIIPRIDKVIKPSKTVFEIPSICPSCSTSLTIEGEYIVCPNSNSCPAQRYGRIANWIKELEILEWGTSLIEKICDSGLVVDISDLYNLSIADLASLERMGEKSATKCHALLWEKMEIPLETFIGGLSIPLIGESMVQMLIGAGMNSLNKIQSATIEEMENVNGFGHTKAESLYNGLKDNKILIDKLLKIGLKIKDKEMKRNTNGKLSGKSFCFTGKASMPRAELQAMVSEAGGENHDTVKSGTNFLVMIDPTSGSSKAVKARKYGTDVISEDAFLLMVK